MEKRSRRTTITDIAREAGVSVATVSRVLNNTDYPVKESLRRTILEVAKGLDYQPNIFSQVLKGGVNRVIGIIVPTITNPFYAQLVSDVEEHCVAAGYAPIICSSHNSADLEKKQLEMLLRQQVGGILLSTINNDKAFVKSLKSGPAPCVLFDQPVEGYRGDSVVFDFKEGGVMAAGHLLERGHRRIAFASRGIDRTSRRLIHEGYCEEMRKNGIRPDPALTATISDADSDDVSGHGDYQCGRLLAEKLMRLVPLPEAVVASNDIIAIGMMHTMAERGLSVPDDISIIGFDDIAFAEMAAPALTTIRQSTAKTAEMAIEILFSRLDNPGGKPASRALAPELVERRSVAAAKSGKWRRN